MEEEKRAKALAVRALAHRALTTQELATKLEAKGVSSSAIQKALAYCRTLGALDDDACLRALAEKEERKGYGPRYIVWRLRAKGAGASLLDSVIADLRKRQSQTLRAYIAKKRDKANWADPRQRQKGIAALERRGFDLEEILRII